MIQIALVKALGDTVLSFKSDIQSHNHEKFNLDGGKLQYCTEQRFLFVLCQVYGHLQSSI